jgi:hypothetical protein
MVRRTALMILATAVASLMLVLPGASTAQRRHPPTVIACAHGYFSDWTFKGHPHRCTEYKGRLRDHASQLEMHRIHWHHWGRKQVKGSGIWIYCCMGGVEKGRVKLLAYHRVHACGRRVYTRLRVKIFFPNFRDSVIRYRLPRCD